MSDDPNSAGIAREGDLRPFRSKALQAIADFLPSSKLSIKSRLLYAVHEAVEGLNDDRLDVLERERVTLQKENAELRGQLDLLTKVDAEVADIMQTREDRSDVWASAKAWLGKQTATEAFAERLAAVEDRLTANVGNTVAAHKRIDDVVRTLDVQLDRIGYIVEVLQHHASLIAGLGRQAVDEAVTDTALRDGPNGVEFPDPVVASAPEELVLERGSIVRVREGAKVGRVVLNAGRDWEVVGFFSPDGEPSTVQIALLPWVGEGSRPMYWVLVEDIVGLA